MKRKLNNPDAAKNLVFFKKGADANRNLAGRPKGKALSTILSELLSKSAGAKLTELAFVKKLTASMTPAQKKQLTTADIVVFRLLSEAIETGDITAIKEILDRTEGKAKQSLDITSNGEAIQAITQIEVVHTIKK